MGALSGKSACSCACDDDNDKAATLTVDPQSVALGDGVIKTNEETAVVLKDDGPSAKHAEITRFKVNLSKPAGSNFGLAHMPMEDGSQSLLVLELRPDGPISRWNLEQRGLGRPEFEMRRGDRIVQVGSTNDIDGMREQLRQDSVEFTVERWPLTVSVALKKRDPTVKYGMQTDLIVRDDQSKVLRVGRISGGLLGEWNMLATGARRYYDVVGQFSEIVRVNDNSDDPERMQQMLVTETEVDLVFARPDPELYNH